MASPNANDQDFSATMDEILPMFGVSGALNYLAEMALAIKLHRPSDEFKALLEALDSKKDEDCDSDSDNFISLKDLHINLEHTYETMLAFLVPTEDDKCASNDFDYDAILAHIINCARHHNREDLKSFNNDITEMVHIGLCCGNIRKDQLKNESRERAERIKELAYWYKIPMRSDVREKIPVRSDTLTFVRAIHCFPHYATLRLFTLVGNAPNGAKTVLASEQLPAAMKHCGFTGLIPTCSDPYLMKAYLFAHVAYMVDFGKLVNPGDKRSLKEVALNQMNFRKGTVKKLPYCDEFRVGVFSVVGLSEPSAFKKIVEVCNNLCKVVGEPELTFETAEKNHIKNGVICFFEDACKDVAAREKMKDMADELKSASVHGSSTSKN